MIPGQFAYHAPASVKEAITLLVQYGEEAAVLAGGHSLLPMMKLRFAQPAHLVDINRIPELRGIREAQGMIHIGAMTTESELIASPLLNEKCPLIPETARLIADPQVRNRGTVGGDVVNGDPSNDHPAVMMALDASLVLRGPGGERVVAANGFYQGTYLTQRHAEELLVEIRIPIPPSGTGQAYCKLKRKTGDYAAAAAAVVLQLDGTRCRKAGIALTNVAPTPLKAGAAEGVLIGQVIDESRIEQAAVKVMAICDPAEDLRGDAEYRTHMAAEMTRRAIRLALQRAQGSSP
jgi:carbon-monoxide dehydrogenase medium subunit